MGTLAQRYSFGVLGGFSALFNPHTPLKGVHGRGQCLWQKLWLACSARLPYDDDHDTMMGLSRQ